LKRQCVASQDHVVFARARARDAKVVDFDSGLMRLDQGEVIVGEWHGRSNRKGIAQSGYSIDVLALLLREIGTRVAQPITAQTSAIIASGGETINVQRVAGQEGVVNKACECTQGNLGKRQRQGNVKAE
jgi:hypothetical protein